MLTYNVNVNTLERGAVLYLINTQYDSTIKAQNPCINSIYI